MPAAWPAFAIFAFLAATFGPTIAAGGLLATADSLAVYYPLRVLGAQALLAGEMPFWNPYAFGGFPVWAMGQSGAWFPGNAPFLVLPPVAAMNASVLLAYVMAGGGTYAFARALALPRAAATLAALVFVGGGFMVGRLELLTAIHAAALLPAILWAIERFRQTLAARYAMAGAVLVAFQVMAGHPQYVVLSALLAAPWALYRARGLAGRARGAYLGQLALMGAVAMLLALPQVLPLMDHLGQNARARLTYAELTAHSYDLRHMLTMLFPFLFGGHPTGWYPTPYWGIGPFFVDLTGYAGLGTLMLAPIALLGAGAYPQARFWAVAAAAAAWLSLGPWPVYALWHQLPVLNTMRAPGRHALELDFALAMLAAYGLAALMAAAPARRPRLAAIGAAAVGLPLLAVAGAIALGGAWYAARLQPYMPAGLDLAAALHVGQPAVWVPLAVGLACAAALGMAAAGEEAWRRGALLGAVALDLWLFGQHAGFRQLAPRPGALPAPWRQDEARVLVVSESSFPYRDYPHVAQLHMPNLNLLIGERHVGGAEGFMPDRRSRLLGGMGQYGWLPDGSAFGPAHHGLDILATAEVRVRPEALREPFRAGWFPAPRWRRAADADGLAVFTNPRALPRAWRVREAHAVPAAEVDRRVTADPAFAPATTALLDAEDGPAVGPCTPGTAAAHAPGPNAIALETAGDGPGLVVVSEAHDPGWRAFLGDRELPIRRVDGLVLGVVVPPGRHAITLRMEPRTWRAGLAAAGFGLLLLGLWGLAARRLARRKGAADGPAGMMAAPAPGADGPGGTPP